jgi:hypothetical protein
MVIITGAPVKVDSSIYIGSVILSPGGRVSVYAKKYLHTREENFVFLESSMRISENQTGLNGIYRIINPVG